MKRNLNQLTWGDIESVRKMYFEEGILSHGEISDTLGLTMDAVMIIINAPRRIKFNLVNKNSEGKHNGK